VSIGRRLRWTIVSITGVVILIGSAGLAITKAPRPEPTSDWTSPVQRTSPDGTMSLTADVVEGNIRLQIRDGTRDTTYTDQTGISGQVGWNVEWMSNSRIRLIHEIVGELYWERLPGGTWRFVPKAIV